MGIQNATILVGGTVATTGGTSTAFTPNGVDVKGGVQLIDAANANAVTRAMITVRNVRAANLDPATGKYKTKWKRFANIIRPLVLSSGAVTFPVVRIEVEAHPESTQAQVDQLCSEAAQLLTDSDFQAFWRTGSLG